MKLVLVAYVAISILLEVTLATEPALIPIERSWRVFAATETNPPPPGWTGVEFDDGSWPLGDSTLGYPGQFHALTQLFRGTFQLGSPSEVSVLIWRGDYSGGCVLFLNGVEVFRRGFEGAPSWPLPWNIAPDHPVFTEGAQEITLPIENLPLRSGTNIFSIELHQPGYWAPVWELLANISRGPFVQNTSSNRVDLLWRTPLVGRSWVEFGSTTNDFDRVAIADSWRSNSMARLEQLVPSTDYFYRVAIETPHGVQRTPVQNFRTFAVQGPIRFLAVGDTGAGGVPQMAIARAMESQQADLVFHLGDILYPGFSQSYSDTRCLSVYRRQMRVTPFFFSWGNHDLLDEGAPAFLSTFRMPTNNVSIAELDLDRTYPPVGASPDSYYSFDHGDAHFAVLFQPFFSQYYLRPGCAQYRWLVEDLFKSSSPWKFIILHHPINTSGGHRKDDYNYNGIEDRLELQSLLLPLAHRAGVQLILNGHDHNYERFLPEAGVHFITSGGGGAVLYPLATNALLDIRSVVFRAVYHFLDIEVGADLATIQARDATGAVIDEFALPRRPSVPGFGESRFDSKGDTDGDGLLDGWELSNALDPWNSTGDDGRHGDPDRDGFTNLDEEWAQTHPRNAGSRPRLNAVSINLESVRLSWPGLPLRRVVIEASDQLPGGFIPIRTNTPTGPVPHSMETWLTGRTNNARFFRVRWLEP